MTRVHTPNIAVLAVVLAVLTMAITPMAVAATPGETTTGTTIGDQLGGAGDSSDDSTDDGDGSTDSTTTDDGSSTDDSSTSDSTDDSSGSTDDSTDGSSDDSTTTDDSADDDSADDDSDDDSADDGSTDETASDDSTDDDDLDLTETNVTNTTESLLSDDFTEQLSTTDVTGTLTDATSETDSRSGDRSDGNASGLQTLDASVFGSTTTTGVTRTLDTSTQTLLSETQFVLSAVEAPSTVGTTSATGADVGAERLEPVPEATQSYETGGDRIPLGGSNAGSTPLPPGPTAGLALGAGALAAAGVGRNAAVAPTLLTNLGSALGSALTASLAPIAGRASVLDRLIRMLAPFRYSRYDDSDPLEHDARADVYEVVNEAPGAYLSEVAEEADLPLSTARHHIRVLEREELVSGAKVRGKRRFYPAYTQGIELAAALNDEATAAVIDAVARFGAASVSDLATELGRDPSTVSHHLKRLAEDDIIVRERDGRAVMNKLSSEARTALEPGSESPVTEAGEAMASD